MNKGCKMIIIDAELKQFSYAKKAQKGKKTRYLHTYNNSRLCDAIEDIKDFQERCCKTFKIETDLRRPELQHGVVSKARKSIEGAWQDIDNKSEKIRQNPFRADWTEGEIAMLNGVSEIICREARQIDPASAEQLMSRMVVLARVIDSEAHDIYINYPLPNENFEKISSNRNPKLYQQWNDHLQQSWDTKKIA